MSFNIRRRASGQVGIALMSFVAAFAASSQAFAGSCYDYCGGDGQAICPVPCDACDPGMHYDINSATCRSTCVGPSENGRDDGYSCDSYSLYSHGCGEAGDRSCADMPFCASWAPYDAATARCQIGTGCAPKPDVNENRPSTGRDLTFLVATDLHAGATYLTDIQRHVRLMNKVGSPSYGLKWPKGYASQYQLVAPPVAVVTTGDLTNENFFWEKGIFQTYYEKHDDVPYDHLNLPLYVGLGNHDFHTAPGTFNYTNMLDYLDRRMSPGAGCNIIASGNYDDDPNNPPSYSNSRNYSWNWQGVHLVQLHDWAGSTEGSRFSGISWLRADLDKARNEGKPVLLFQHFGFDGSIDNTTAWSDANRAQLAQTIKDSGADVRGIFVGHAHVAKSGTWHTPYDQHIKWFQGSTGGGSEGSTRGKGGFLVVHMTDTDLDVGNLVWDNRTGDHLRFDTRFTGGIGLTTVIEPSTWSAPAIWPKDAPDGRPGNTFYRINDQTGSLQMSHHAGNGFFDVLNSEIGWGWSGLPKIFAAEGWVYAIDGSGQLLVYHHDAAGHFDNYWGTTIGWGWSGFTHVFAGRFGRIYAVDTAGQLFLYKHDASFVFDDYNPPAIGWAGWNSFSQLFSGGEGAIYGITSTGELRYYYHDSNNAWVHSGHYLGGGFDSCQTAASTGNGEIYCVHSNGDMYFYRHDVNLQWDGSGGNGTLIGWDWDFGSRGMIAASY